jgi:hypothetical protein
MEDSVFKDRLDQLVTLASPEKWDLKVFRDYLDPKDLEDPREMVAPLVEMV